MPELIETREAGRLSLRWRTPGDLPFPVPVEVQVGDRVERLAMAKGSGSLAVPADAHVVVDPMSRLLRRAVAIEQYQVWRRRPS